MLKIKKNSKKNSKAEIKAVLDNWKKDQSITYNLQELRGKLET
jgi:hypothetical protein